MKDTTEHLERLESEVKDHGHSERDLDWSRDAYFRLLLSQVQSSPAQGEVRRAAEAARGSAQSLEQLHGEPGVWAEATVHRWLRENPERFIRHRGETENTWSLRSALWGIPAVAAGMSFLFALFTVIPGWGPDQMSLGWILVPGAIAVPIILLHAVYSSTLGRRGNLRAVAAAVVVVAISAVVIAVVAMATQDVLLPQGVPWIWIATGAWTLLAVVAWQLAQRIPGSGAHDDLGLPRRVHAAEEPVDDRTWADQFRSALFHRRVLKDSDVDRAVHEALTHAQQSGNLAVEEFGSPWDYAHALAEDPVVRPRRMTLFTGALAAAWTVLFAAQLVEGLGMDEVPVLESVFRAGMLLLLFGATISSARDWRRAVRLKTERTRG